MHIPDSFIWGLWSETFPFESAFLSCYFLIYFLMNYILILNIPIKAQLINWIFFQLFFNCLCYLQSNPILEVRLYPYFNNTFLNCCWSQLSCWDSKQNYHKQISNWWFVLNIGFLQKFETLSRLENIREL